METPVLNQILKYWHNTEEAQHILMGLALVISMPIAGSSTAWSQNANGNMLLSISLVLITTVLSPLTTPVVLHAIGFIASGEYAIKLHSLAEHGTGLFLTFCVMIPSFLGLAAKYLIGEKIHLTIKPHLKTLNVVVLWILVYSNASLSLPEVIKKPDLDFLGVLLAITVSLCIFSFWGGWILSKMLGLNDSQKVAVMFGLGMNNNGTSLVLATIALSEYPKVMLPIIMYNLVQHIVAAGVDRWMQPQLTFSHQSIILNPKLNSV